MRGLNELLHIKYPVIQGGMARITNGKFAAQCSNAGILGTIASGGLTPDELINEIELYKVDSNKPFAVNIPADHLFLKDVIEVVINAKVQYAIVGNGNTVKIIEELSESNLSVIPVVGSPEFAKYYERAGAKFIIAEGRESGGHIGRMSTMTLVPQVCDLVSIPVIAAGGIADNRQFRAAKALGACGVQIGTALLVSEECPIHENYKTTLIKAKGSATTVTGRILQDEVRVINNNLAKQYHVLEDSRDLDAISMLLKGSYNSAVVDGDVKNGTVMAGEVSSQLKYIEPLNDIVASICGEDIS